MTNSKFKRRLAEVDQFRVYIGNVLTGRGKWYDLPMDEQELDAILSRFVGDYEIQDYEAPRTFRISSGTDIYKLNAFLQHAEEYSIPLDVAGYIFTNYGDIDLEEIMLFGPYEGTDSDVAKAYAEDYLEETGLLKQVPEELRNFIDVAAYAEEMRIDGAFVVVGQYVMLYPR